MFLIPQPDTNSIEYINLNTAQREDLRMWTTAFREIPFTKPVMKWMDRVAKALDVSVGTVKNKYYALKKNNGDWRVLVNKSLASHPDTECRTNNKEFRTYLLTLAEKHQRNSAAAIKKLKMEWRQGKLIPGYQDQPGWPNIPEGWSKRQLSRIINEESDRATMRSIRIGVSSKTNTHLPQVFTTRKGLWPGSVYQLDDVWHDNFVTVGKNHTPARVIEIGALDLFSAARIHWGAKPRLKNQNGSYENLREADTTFFLAGLFHGIGYSQRGTMLMVEHGAAAVTERVERILYDASGGLIRLDRQPIEGKQQALTGFWGGTEGGNFRAKAALESSHNLIHNDLAHLALQTGMTADHRPVHTDRQLRYISRIIKDVMDKAPHRAHLLKLPSLDFHSQFIPLLNDYYRHGLNGRTEHNLEGWHELGFFVTEYTALPGSDQWLSQQQFLGLPDASQAIIYANAQQDPRMWSRKRNLSPWEVWQPAANSLVRISDHIVADILGPSMAREEKVKGKYFHWHEQGTVAAELIYEARILTPHGHYQELPHGEKYAVFCNPFEDRWLFVTDARGKYLGKAELFKRINPINEDAFSTNNPWESRPEIRSEDLKQAAGHKHARIADIHEPVRMRHIEEVREAQELREHNKRVINGEETDPQKRRSIRAKKAAKTRDDNLSEETLTSAFDALADIREETTEGLEF